MRAFLLLLIIPIMMCSCATLIHKKEYSLNFSASVENSKIQLNDSLIDLPAKIKVERSKEDLSVVLISDSIKRNFIVKSSPNNAFLFGNLLWFEFCPIAYLIDFSNPKRYYYGKSVTFYLKSLDSVIIPQKTPLAYFSREFPTKAGQMNFSFSIPYINSFYQKPPFEPNKSNTGFWGASLGLEYYYKDYNYLAINANTASDFFAPIGPADIFGEYDMMSTMYLSLTDNHRFNRFSAGYGINFSSNSWDHRNYSSSVPLREPIKRVSHSIGLTLNGYNQIGQHLFIGVIYRPTILRVSPDVAFKYEHLISLDFAFKYRIK